MTIKPVEKILVEISIYKYCSNHSIHKMNRCHGYEAIGSHFPRVKIWHWAALGLIGGDVPSYVNCFINDVRVVRELTADVRTSCCHSRDELLFI